MVSNVVWPVISSIMSTGLIAVITAVYRSIKKQHERFDSIDNHLRQQDLRIARIEGKVS